MFSALALVILAPTMLIVAEWDRDTPVYMATDNKKGETHAMISSREDYVEMMQPMYANAPKAGTTETAMTRGEWIAA